MFKLGEKMVIRTQPNNWSCTVAATATVLDIEISTLVELIGHDGSEIVFDDLPDPLCRRSFSLQEIGFALWNLGYIFTGFDVEPLGIVDEDHMYSISYPDGEKRFEKLMKQTVGVGCGKIVCTDITHAFAWNGIKCFDPTGFIYPVSRYELYSYHVISPRL